MYKAPVGRVETIHQALGSELRNLPMPEPSERIAGALMRAVQDVAQLLQAQDEPAHQRCQQRKGNHG